MSLETKVISQTFITSDKVSPLKDGVKVNLDNGHIIINKDLSYTYNDNSNMTISTVLLPSSQTFKFKGNLHTCKFTYKNDEFDLEDKNIKFRKLSENKFFLELNGENMFIKFIQKTVNTETGKKDIFSCKVYLPGMLTKFNLIDNFSSFNLVSYVKEKNIYEMKDGNLTFTKNTVKNVLYHEKYSNIISLYMGTVKILSYVNLDLTKGNNFAISSCGVCLLFKNNKIEYYRLSYNRDNLSSKIFIKFGTDVIDNVIKTFSKENIIDDKFKLKINNSGIVIDDKDSYEF